MKKCLYIERKCFEKCGYSTANCVVCLVKELKEAREKIKRLEGLEGKPNKTGAATPEFRKPIPAPPPMPKSEPKVFYECDRRKCEMCSYPECNKTADITHAQNFRSDGLGSYEEIMNEA